jgi:2-C-methyl-D-erythritol 4-phosphate cytidylyltransferase/2-C-methyl-D-erythritol 2,4-cyclodiphosphate synthase
MIRIGFGYDAHRLVAGRPLILGGVEIPFDRGLLGHSDADVLLHAVCDALLGACALGDLGQHFPDADPRWKGVSSLTLLHKVRALIGEAGFEVRNVDSTIVAQAPRLAPHLELMNATIAAVLEIEAKQVSVKAKTTEGMGFTGSGEGIAAYAVASIRRRARVGEKHG